MNKLFTVFKIPELRLKIGITLLFLAIYRIGYYVPLPFINQEKMAEFMGSASQGALGQALGFVSMFSGGTMSQAVIFTWGVMPYISASIIFQLLASVYPPLEKLQKEGESGRKKINEYTRYATVFIAIIQSTFLVRWLMGSDDGSSGGAGMALPGYGGFFDMIVAVMTMTAGTIFLMWLGEQIDEYGIGNGISLIIMAGIVARIPEATARLVFDRTTGWIKQSVFTLGGTSGQDVSFEKLMVLVFLFVAVVVAVIAITQGQRRIPTQSAKHVRGRRVWGGTRNYLPLRVNQSGVMPVIFASSLLLLPTFGLQFLAPHFRWAAWLSESFTRQGYLYNLLYISLIFFFCYFWTAISFNPKDMANNLKDHGSFIPGYRPGKNTEQYLERVLMRITYVGAAFLAVVAVIPSMISGAPGMDVDPLVASFYGGTGLLIVISVALDLVQKINSHLVMRNYPGLTES